VAALRGGGSRGDDRSGWTKDHGAACDHTVPAVGYLLDSGKGSLVFTGDTGPNDALWVVVNRIENLKFLIIETAFSDKDRWLAELSKHLCPSMLGEQLAKLERPRKSTSRI
jgi:ribonuclease BN (tRNA processing enzyme)